MDISHFVRIFGLGQSFFHVIMVPLQGEILLTFANFHVS